MSSTEALAFPSSPTLSAASERAAQALTGYLSHIGVDDEDLCQRLASECLKWAGNQLPADADAEDWLIAAIEELYRRVDRSIETSIGTRQGLAAQQRMLLRSALLLAKPDALPGKLLSENPAFTTEELLRAVPQAVPVESPLPMPDQVLRFVLDSGPAKKT